MIIDTNLFLRGSSGLKLLIMIEHVLYVLSITLISLIELELEI